MNIHIKSYEESMRREWEDMFIAYFKDDLDDDLSEEIIRGKICDFILRQESRKIVSICVPELDGRMIGFGIYQIDKPESDWCKHEGWGFIREFYIVKKMRRQGYGSKLAAFIENELYRAGAERLYLTSDKGAVCFWEACGYRLCGEAGQNGTYEMTK